MQGKPHRKRVTFEWNADDLLAVIASSFRPGEENAKWIDLPQPKYASSGFDRVMLGDRIVGLSMFNGYSFNERAMLSLGVVDPDIREGDVLTLVWGEPDGGTAKTATERHRQADIRVRVSPCRMRGRPGRATRRAAGAPAPRDVAPACSWRGADGRARASARPSAPYGRKPAGGTGLGRIPPV
jgi:hypothetical protein